MATIRKDHHGVFIITNGSMVRPFKDKPTNAVVGQKVKSRHLSGSQIHIVNGEEWVSVGLSPESARSHGVPATVNPPISSTEPHYP